MREYSNLSIRMRDFDGQRFAVEVLERPVGTMRQPDYATFDWGVLPLLEKLDELRGNQEDLTPRDLRELGEMLGGMLFTPTVREVFRKSVVSVMRQQRESRGARPGGGNGPRRADALRIVLHTDDATL